MAKQLEPGRGGNNRRSPGAWIRDHLPDTGHNLYIGFKTAVQSEPGPEYLKTAHRRLRTIIASEKRTEVKKANAEANSKGAKSFLVNGVSYTCKKGVYCRPRVKVEEREIEARLSSWEKDHPFKGTRKCCNYNSFMHYIYVMRQLGWIKGTDDYAEAQAKGPNNSPTRWHESHPSEVLTATGKAADWEGFWKAYGSGERSEEGEDAADEE